MAVLAILQPDTRASARLTHALTPVHRVVCCATWRELREALEAGTTHGCVIDCTEADHANLSARIRRLDGAWPELTMIAYVDRRDAHAMFELGELGMHGFLQGGSGPHTYRADVDRALATGRGGIVARRLASRFPSPGPAALAWAVANASSDPSVEQMAAAFGRTTRELREALDAVGLPGPFRLLVWGRLLLAGARLSEDGRGVEDVAFSLGYSAGTSLARAMKQHTCYTPRQITRSGGMSSVLSALLPAGHVPHSRPREPRRRMSRRTSRIAGTASLLLAGACATFASGGVDRSSIQDVLASPGIDQMHVGVLAVDIATGRVLYEQNSEKKFVPASNQKILVTATAMTMLGPDYRFRTEAWGVGARDGGTLKGDLVVVGAGDPTMSARFWDSGTSALAAFADSVRASGVKRVTGSLRVDVSAWDSSTVGPTWEVEDLRFAYGSTGGAFAIDEGEVEVRVESGPAVGAPARVEWSPMGSDDYVRSLVHTGAPGSPTRVRPHYLPETRRLDLAGTVSYGVTDTVAFALRDPVRQASAALASAIEEAGVVVEGGWEVVWSRGEPLGGVCVAGTIDSCPEAGRLAAIESPPLVEIVEGILEPSQNWMTEQLIRSLGAAYGEEGSWSEGVDLVEAFLVEHVGVDSLDVSARDGSGLSAYNLVTPRAIVRVLLHMNDGPFAEQYRASLAEPGEEGSSLSRRLEGLEGRVFAKTGTISNVNSLSGYLVRDSGRDVVFSILTNGSGLPSGYVRSAIDDIVRALAR